MKCQIPSFVADFVHVISWHTDQNETFYPGREVGVCFLPLTSHLLVDTISRVRLMLFQSSYSVCLSFPLLVIDDIPFITSQFDPIGFHINAVTCFSE